MAKLSTLFDASKVKPQAVFEIIPKGKYPGVIVASAMKPTKDAGGSYLELEADIIDGEYKGRKLFTRLNLKNKSVKAVEIAQAELSAICHATGVMKVADSIELHNKPVLITVGVEPTQVDDKGKELYAAKNGIKGWEPLEGALPAPAATATPGALPWGKKPAAPVAPAPAAKAVKPTPPAPKPAPAPEPEPAPVEGIFYVMVGEEAQEKSAAEITAMLDEGMPSDTPVCKEGDSDWGTAETYGLAATPSPDAEPAPAAPAKKLTPPWGKKK